MLSLGRVKLNRILGTEMQKATHGKKKEEEPLLCKLRQFMTLTFQQFHGLSKRL
jgi:hypothetical protein